MRIPELLSPAGNADAMVAAVQCGADAVYLGAGNFNARGTAENFGGTLRSATGYCHARGVKVYVTLNTMVREDEYALLEETIGEIAASGADAVIVQDIGVARTVRRMCPQIALHASTQMAVHNPQGVEFLVKNGFSRIVLARELRYDEIRRCQGLGAELEVFVHGALCVACSGQCLLSSMIGGRSGNRGMCAQPCRMRYRAGDREGYFLSTRDLCGLEGLKALIDAGAASLKIEGRLKRPEYVGETTRIYREALTSVECGTAFDADAAVRDLKQMFNRGGFTRGYGFGVDDSELMYSERPNHLGLEIGICRANGRIETGVPVDSRDALVLRRGDRDIPVRANDYARAIRGDRLVRLVSQKQMADVQARFAGEQKKFPVDAALALQIGERARLVLTDGERTATAEGDVVQAASAKPADPEKIGAQLGKLGDTPFALRDVRLDIDSNAFAPASMLNALRREAAQRLIDMRAGGGHEIFSRYKEASPATEYPDVPKIYVQSADCEALRIALESGADGVVFAPRDVRPDALARAARELPDRFFLQLPAVLAEAPLRALNIWAREMRAHIAGVYITNIAQLDCEWPGERIADYTMNTASEASIAQLREWGIDVYTPSIELNCAQISRLGGRRQLIVHGDLPLMYLRHCPYRAIHALRGKHADCRRCDFCAAGDRAEDLSLIDRTGAAFALRRVATDDGCVLQLLNSVPMLLLKKAGQLPRAEAWRILADAPADVAMWVRLYRAAAQGRSTKSDPDWAKVEKTASTTGHYFRGV